MKSFVPADKVSFEHTFKVKSSHIDNLNHVNNTVYLQWVQEVANLHWNNLVPNEMKEAIVWMVLRHEIDYLGQAFLDDEITVYTWIDETIGVKSTRIVHIYRNDTLLSKSKTTFCSLDKTTLKPRRISDEMLTLFTKTD